MNRLKLTILSLFVFVLNANSQVESWYKSDLGRLGYKHNNLTFQDVPKLPEENKSYSDNISTKGGSFDLAVDMYFKHVYFHVDGSVIPDFFVSSFPNPNQKERWYDNDEYFVERGQIFPFRLAFGLPITKYFGLYAGGQWQHLTTGLRWKNTGDRRRETLIKGNQRGYGVHGIFAYRKLLIRQTFMQDWLRAARTWTGKAITNETTIMYGFKKLGVFVNFNHMWRQKNGGFLPSNYQQANRLSSVGNSEYHAREQMTQFTLSFGIYASGLFSGVTAGISDAAVKVESGNAKERRNKKRNTIEYKE